MQRIEGIQEDMPRSHARIEDRQRCRIAGIPVTGQHICPVRLRLRKGGKAVLHHAAHDPVRREKLCGCRDMRGIELLTAAQDRFTQRKIAVLKEPSDQRNILPFAVGNVRKEHGGGIQRFRNGRDPAEQRDLRDHLHPVRLHAPQGAQAAEPEHAFGFCRIRHGLCDRRLQCGSAFPMIHDSTSLPPDQSFPLYHKSPGMASIPLAFSGIM